ncbi:RNA polymerase subunit sigma-70 [Vibrio cholerae]|nr:RNA polymerase subunit sigma-70 [Vibrio cholerae]
MLSFKQVIPFLLKVAAVLATFVHPNHIVIHLLAAYLQLQVVWVY